MRNSSSRPKDAEELVEDLLAQVRQLSKIDPSPLIRERLQKLASQRLKEASEEHSLGLKLNPRRAKRLVPALAGALLIFLLAGAEFVVQVRQKAAHRAQTAARVSSPENSMGLSVSVAHTPPPHRKRARSPRRTPQPATQAAGAQLTVQLPYSNVAIANGTSVTIQVAMSRSELLALGFPMSPALQDRRVVAELSLGDDGLPRAISLPLPLQFVKEVR